MNFFRKRSLTLNSLLISEVIQILSFRRIVTVFVPLHPLNSSHAISTVGCSEIIDSQSVLELDL
jgi:hypothetical protein